MKGNHVDIKVLMMESNIKLIEVYLNHELILEETVNDIYPIISWFMQKYQFNTFNIKVYYNRLRVAQEDDNMKKWMKILIICLVCLFCLGCLGSCMLINYSFDYLEQQQQELDNMPLY